MSSEEVNDNSNPYSDESLGETQLYEQQALAHKGNTDLGPNAYISRLSQIKIQNSLANNSSVDLMTTKLALEKKKEKLARRGTKRVKNQGSGRLRNCLCCHQQTSLSKNLTQK